MSRHCGACAHELATWTPQYGDALSVRGYTLVVSVDGGRLRQRRGKRGRKPNKLKRQGYHTDWRAPKLFTLYLLERYLCTLPIEQLARIVFCGDGGPWIWHGVEALCQRWVWINRRFIKCLTLPMLSERNHFIDEPRSARGSWQKMGVAVMEWPYNAALRTPLPTKPSDSRR
jgi:hypothetical protein